MKYFLLLLLFALSAQANEAAYNRGENIYFVKVCNGCHGVDAKGGGIYPSLAHKKRKYLLDKLHYFKKGKVSTQNQEMMVQFIRTMSEEEMQDLVTFLSEHKEKVTEDVADHLLGGFGS